MLRLMENMVEMGFKLETTPYTAETLTSAEYNQRIYDIKVSPEIESYARKLARADYSREVSISGKRKCVVTCSVDLYPGSSVSTAPQYFAMIQACGWKQLAHGSTGISLTPNADYNRVPATIEVAYREEGTTPRQLVIKMHGAMGKLKIDSPQIGQPIKLMFEFTGVLTSITTRAYASIILPTAWDTALPPAVLAATFSLFATWQFPSKFMIDGGEDVQLYPDMSKSQGYDGARVVDRVMVGETDPDMVVTEDLDLHTPQINNTTGALSVTIGGSVPFYITAPAAQIADGYKPEFREGHVVNPLKLEFKRGTNGNDELEILQGSKS
jgi:hypothetical protein